ncbi:MAG: ArnT family glycosyltransferase [Chthoniobacterales bacterium]
MTSAPIANDRVLVGRGTWLLVIAVTVICFLTTNLPWELDDYDQAQQAFTSFEMIKEGHWFYQRTPHELIAQKPPLVGWVSAGFFAATRSWALAWRLPSLICAGVLAYCVWRAATIAYGSLPGLVALSAFSLNLLTVRLATLVRTDMPLALALFLAGWLVFEKLRRGEPWTARDRWMFCVLIALSMWIKGPFAFVFLLPAQIVMALYYRKKSVAGAGPGWWPWLVSVALFAPWLAGGLLLYPTFYKQIIGFEVVSRFSTNVHHPYPIYFYIAHLLHKFAPWSILSTALAVIAWRNRRVISPPTVWLLLWSLTGLAIMSLVPSKRVDRVYSIIAPLSLLLAAQVAAVISNPERRNACVQWLRVCLAAAVVFTLGYTTWKIGFGYHDHLDALRQFGKSARNDAQLHDRRFQVISGLSGSEGMLLYLDKLHFTEPEEAVQEWNRGDIDALVLPTNATDEVLPQLQGDRSVTLRSTHRNSQPRVDYELVVKNR